MDMQTLLEQLKERRTTLQKEIEQMEQQANMLHANLNAYSGALAEVDNWIERLAQENNQAAEAA